MKTLTELANAVPAYVDIYIDKRDLIAASIRAILKSKNMTQAALSASSGIGEPQISDILRGDVNLTLKTISRIEDALGETIIQVRHSESHRTVEHAHAQSAERDRLVSLFNKIHDTLTAQFQYTSRGTVDVQIEESRMIPLDRDRTQGARKEEFDFA